jgi:hypothetical protein
MTRARNFKHFAVSEEHLDIGRFIKPYHSQVLTEVLAAVSMFTLQVTPRTWLIAI